MARILVCSVKHDVHVAIVGAALRDFGHELECFTNDEFPLDDSHTFKFTEGHTAFTSNANQFDSDGRPFDAVWNRRLMAPLTPDVFEDPDDLAFARRTNAFYGAALTSCLTRSFDATRAAFWINTPLASHIGENKLLQLHEALLVGLTIPETIVSNDPQAVRAFCVDVHGPVICKPLLMPERGWRGKEGRNFAPLTSVLPPVDEIPPESIQVVPAIYQRQVFKRYEIRAVFMGDHHLSMRIDSQQTERGKVDWRGDLTASCEPYELPASIVEKCRLLMRSMSLRFACFDFIRSTDGEYIFLELNQAGQFLFMERTCPEIKILSAFCHFLVRQSLDDWSATSASVAYADIIARPEINAQIAAAGQAFVAFHNDDTNTVHRAF